MNSFLSKSSMHSFNNKDLRTRAVKVINGRILRNHTFVNEDLWIKGGRIIDPQCRFWDAQRSGELEPADEVIDARGAIVAPGFIDIQINGAFGIDFSDPCITKEEVDFVAANLVRYGVTGFLPTVVSSQPNVYRTVTKILEPKPFVAETSQPNVPDLVVPSKRAFGMGVLADPTSKGAINLGIHLEGPFMNKKQKGAHEVAAIAAPKTGYDALVVRR